MANNEPAPRPNLSQVKTSIAREIAMRKAVYGKPGGRMGPEEKAHEIACMEEAQRILEVVGQLRKRIGASAVVNELATMVKMAGLPTDPFVERHQLGAAHHPPAIAGLIADEIMAALK